VPARLAREESPGRPKGAYNNKEKGKIFIYDPPIGIRLRRNRAGDTCGMLVNLEIETDRRSPGDKDIICRAEQMFKRHDAGME
jgi:hypothetical protein